MSSTTDKRRLIWDAVASRDINQLRNALAENSDQVDATLPQQDRAPGWTPLHFAAQGGLLEMVVELMDAGSRAMDKFAQRDSNIWGSPSSTPVMIAAAHGHAEVVAALVRGDRQLLDLSSETERDTAMHLAASYGHIAVIEILLHLGSQALDAPNTAGMRPIGLAAQNGQAATVEALVRLGSKALDTPNFAGLAPMHLAANCGRSEVIEILVRLGSQAIDLLTEPIAAIPIGAGGVTADVNSSDDDSDFKQVEPIGFVSPLGLAAECGHAHTVETLVRLGSKAIDLPRSDGRTPMHHAAGSGYRPMIELLARLGSQSINAVDETGSTPLHYAARLASPEVIFTLVRFGSRSMDVMDNEGETPLENVHVDFDEEPVPDEEEEPVPDEQVRSIQLLWAVGDSPLSFVPAVLRRVGADINEDKVQQIRSSVYFAESLLDRLLSKICPPALPLPEHSPVCPWTVDLAGCINSAFRDWSSNIALVIEHAGCSPEEAEAALRDQAGDIVSAILQLMTL